MNNPNLTDRLYECGAVFAKDIDKQMSPIISFLLTGILPLIIFIALGNYMAKKLMEHAGGKNSDRKSTRLNSSHRLESRMPSSA